MSRYINILLSMGWRYQFVLRGRVEGEPADPGLPGRMALCVCVCVL